MGEGSKLRFCYLSCMILSMARPLRLDNQMHCITLLFVVIGVKTFMMMTQIEHSFWKH